ncbi:unnamed protein product, partial [Iphiclides podalirius]
MRHFRAIAYRYFRTTGTQQWSLIDRLFRKLTVGCSAVVDEKQTPSRPNDPSVAMGVATDIAHSSVYPS